MFGGGLFMESGSRSYGNNPGAVLRLSYGLDVRFDEQWSVMPGAGLRLQLGDIRHFMWGGWRSGWDGNGRCFHRLPLSS